MRTYLIAAAIVVIAGGAVWYILTHNSNLSATPTSSEVSANRPVQNISPQKTSVPIHPMPKADSSVAVSPSIASIVPSSGVVGTQVTIHGSGFTSTNNYARLGIFWIGPITSSDGKTLVFTIPSSASVCDPLQVSCNAEPQNITPGPSYVLTIWNVNGTAINYFGSISGLPEPSPSLNEPSADIEQVSSAVPGESRQSPPSLTTSSVNPTVSGGAYTDQIKLRVYASPGYSTQMFSVALTVVNHQWSATLSGLAHGKIYTLIIDDVSGQGPIWESQLVVR